MGGFLKKDLCQRTGDQRLRRSCFRALSKNTNRGCDNGAQESDRPGGKKL